MAEDEVRVRARIQFLQTDEGGRASPIIGGVNYRPNHNFFGPKNSEMCMGELKFPVGQNVMPGDILELDITLFIWPELLAHITPGRTWRIQEGSKFVGVGYVVRLLH